MGQPCFFTFFVVTINFFCDTVITFLLYQKHSFKTMSETKTITKTDLAKQLVDNGSFKIQAEANKAITAVLNAIETNLVDGNEVSFLGFGKFSIKHRPERQ